MTDFPTASLNPVQRLEVMAAAMPDAVVVERRYDATGDAVWDRVADLENTMPKIQSHVRNLRVLRREADRLRLLVHGYGGHAYMNGVLQPRWCVIQSRFLVVAIAVDDGPGGARIARLQGLRFPGSRLLRPLVRSNLEDELTRLGELL